MGMHREELEHSKDVALHCLEGQLQGMMQMHSQRQVC